jgi:hypothetical protein
MNKTFLLFKYISLLAIFFAIEVLFHGNEYVPLVLVILYSLYILRRSKNQKAIIYLYAIGFSLGLVIELLLTNIDRVQVWSNAGVLPIPLWLPFAWGVGAVTFYSLGKALENKT